MKAMQSVFVTKQYKVPRLLLLNNIVLLYIPSVGRRARWCMSAHRSMSLLRASSHDTANETNRTTNTPFYIQGGIVNFSRNFNKSPSKEQTERISLATEAQTSPISRIIYCPTKTGCRQLSLHLKLVLPSAHPNLARQKKVF